MMGRIVAAARALIALPGAYYRWQIGFVLGFLKDKDMGGYPKQ